MKPRTSSPFLALAGLLAACATTRRGAPCELAPPDAAAADPDVPRVDGWDDAFGPCPPGLLDEGDACVGWRTLPPPPCAPTSLARTADGRVVVDCGDGTLHAPGATEWERAAGAAVSLVPETDGPWADGLAPHIVVRFEDGSRVGTHGDVYAHPEAWRADEADAWRETVPPPSAFLTHGAALSDSEALFVGRDAFVLTVIRRAPRGR